MLKNTTTRSVAVALVPAALLLFVSGCSTSGNPKSGVTTAAVFQPGVPGGTSVESYKITATVTGVDPVTRQVSLLAADGSRRTVLVGPAYAAFDRLKAGDKVKVAVTKEVVVSLDQSATTADADAGQMAETVLVVAKVTAIDFAMRRVTLRFPDGAIGTFPVRPDVDLARRQPGETVFIRATQSVRLLAE